MCVRAHEYTCVHTYTSVVLNALSTHLPSFLRDGWHRRGSEWVSSQWTDRRQRASPLSCDLLLPTAPHAHPASTARCVLCPQFVMCLSRLFETFLQTSEVWLRGPHPCAVSLENLSEVSKAANLQGRSCNFSTAARRILPVSLILFLSRYRRLLNRRVLSTLFHSVALSVLLIRNTEGPVTTLAFLTVFHITSSPGTAGPWLVLAVSIHRNRVGLIRSWWRAVSRIASFWSFFYCIIILLVQQPHGGSLSHDSVISSSLKLSWRYSARFLFICY